MKPFQILQILNVLHAHPNLYILGAGVSASILPTTSGLSKIIAPKWVIGSSFPAYIQRYPLLERIFEGKIYSSFELDDGLLTLLPPHGLNWMILSGLLPQPIRTPIYTYEIFNLLPGRSSIVSFNLDSIAKSILRKHNLYEPHGSIPESFSDFSQQEIRSFAEYDIQVPYDLVIIAPEKSEILKKRLYEILISQFPLFKNIVIIGYSFSKSALGIDDEYSLLFFSELSKHYNTTIVIIDINPYNVLSLLQANNVYNKIICFELKWELIAELLYPHFYYQRGLTRSNLQKPF